MAEASAIEWCDSTFNPWVGCTKISPACDHCYAEGWAKRSGQVEWGNHPRRRTSPANWRQPLKWQAEAEQFEREHGHRRRVFCASLADVFDNQVPDEWRHDLWSLIERCWGMDWLLLTKRPQNIEKMLPDTPTWENIRHHVWLGTTVEDQQRADQNIPHLMKHDAAVRFVSVEPMLGPVDLERIAPPPWDRLYGFPLVDALRGTHYAVERPVGPRQPGYCHSDWVIAGGESGPQARPSHPDWFRSLRDQCAAAGVPFLFKQWGEWVGGRYFLDLEDWVQFENLEGQILPLKRSDQQHWWDETTTPEGPGSLRFGKKSAGRLLDGIEHNGFPVTHLAGTS